MTRALLLGFLVLTPLALATVLWFHPAGAEWLIVNNAGHPVHFEHPEIVGPRILDFLRRN